MKKTDVHLTKELQDLVADNLCVVHWVIYKNIRTNPNAYGYEYDDLFQEGCVWLCHAALTYNASFASFKTYASAVVQNGLLSYCRKIQIQQSRFTCLTVDEQGKLLSDGAKVYLSDDFENKLSLIETLDLLESRSKYYSGVALLGIKALELKIEGLGVAEIAQLYHAPVPHVGAWISRAVSKLKNDTVFLSELNKTT